MSQADNNELDGAIDKSVHWLDKNQTKTIRKATGLRQTA
jgi:hypothetical protein